MSIRFGLSLCLLLSALSGCNNAAEQISVGRWQEMGSGAMAEAPGSLAGETTQPGSGRAVRSGDLVRARLHVTTPGPAVQMEYPPGADPNLVWLWVGVEPDADATTGDRHAQFGSFGSQALRDALVGHKLHETFALKPAAGESLAAWAPAHAFMAFLSEQPQPTDTVGTFSPLWSATDVESLLRARDTRVELEILQICEAKLFRRKAYLQQWGVVFGWGDVKPQSVRSGTLGWSKLEATRPPPTGAITVQIGPLYTREKRYTGELYEWWDSYRRLRPPGLFWEEWAGASLPD